MKALIFSAAIAFASFSASVANAQVIFDAIAGDAVTTFSNGTNAPPTFAASAPTGTLTRTTVGLSHFVSNDDIQTLNGGTPLTATDVITITWVVDGITGYVNDADPTTTNNPNGIEFGILPNVAFRSTNSNVGTLSRFRGDSGLVNANRVGHGFGNLSVDGPAQTEAEPTVEGTALDDGDPANGEETRLLEGTGDSFADGFTVVQTISAAGVTTQYRDIVVTQLMLVDDGTGTGTEILVREPNGGTVLTTVLEPFASGFDFVTFVNGAHFYAGAETDRTSAAGGVVTFSTAQLEINAVTGPVCLLGDVDLSGAVDFLDISPFITALSNGLFQCEADVDESGAVDFLDISPFIGILSQ